LDHLSELEGLLACQELSQEDPEGVDVRSGAGVMKVEGGWLRGNCRGGQGEAEVSHLGLEAGREIHVVTADVLVHKEICLRMWLEEEGQRAGDLPSDADAKIPGQA